MSLLEFDIWYNECYLSANNANSADELLSSAKASNEFQVYDDAAERFERMQRELMLADLDSAPFRQAQINSHRRVSPTMGCTSRALLRVFQHAFNAVPTSNSGFRSGGSYRQEQPLLPPINAGGSRQKPMVR